MRTKQDIAEYHKQWRKKNQQRLNCYHAQWKEKQKQVGCCVFCNEPVVPGLRRCEKHRQHVNQYSNGKHFQLKQEVVNAYGGECLCCGEDRVIFLTIDHIHDDGASHRREVGEGSTMYKWLKKNGYPKDRFRLLCYNCNCGRSKNGGVCPHQEEAVEDWCLPCVSSSC